jgi:hypothetical protein
LQKGKAKSGCMEDEVRKGRKEGRAKYYKKEREVRIEVM